MDCLEFTPEETINTFEYIKETNPVKYNHVVLGGWLDKAEGVVFENWKYGKFNPDNLQVSYGQDFGFSIDPTTLVAVAINWKAKKLYAKLLHYDKDKGTSDVVNICKQVPPNALIIADSAEPRLISDVRMTGVNITPCVKGQGSVLAGISLLSDFELIIDKDSYKLHKELNNYVWSDRKSKTPIDAFNHAIDPIRYVASWQKHSRKTVRYSRR